MLKLRKINAEAQNQKAKIAKSKATQNTKSKIATIAKSHKRTKAQNYFIFCATIRVVCNVDNLYFFTQSIQYRFANIELKCDFYRVARRAFNATISLSQDSAKT